MLELFSYEFKRHAQFRTNEKQAGGKSGRFYQRRRALRKSVAFYQRCRLIKKARLMMIRNVAFEARLRVHYGSIISYYQSLWAERQLTDNRI